MSPDSSQVGVVVVAHGSLAQGLVDAAEQILGPQPALVGGSLDPSSGDAPAALARLIAEVNRGNGVLVLTDLFGGTPANVALAAAANEPIEVVTGVNLPMLLRALSRRDELSLVELARTAAEYGRQQIMLPNQLLEKNAS